MKSEAGILTEEEFREYLKESFREGYIPPYLDPRYTIKILLPEEERDGF